VTQQNAALVEQAAAAAESLHDQTVNLAKAVSVFQVEGVEGIAGAGDAPAAAEGDAEFLYPEERRATDSPMRGKRATRALEDRRGSARGHNAG
jgi:methyl-accepting chemotaxis protein